MATVSVRYIVDDVDAAISFYCQLLGFHEVMHPAPSFAMLTRADLRLVLSAPGEVAMEAAKPCLTAATTRSPAAGIASSSRSPTSTRWWSACVKPEFSSAMTEQCLKSVDRLGMGRTFPGDR